MIKILKGRSQITRSSIAKRRYNSTANVTSPQSFSTDSAEDSRLWPKPGPQAAAAPSPAVAASHLLWRHLRLWLPGLLPCRFHRVCAAGGSGVAAARCGSSSGGVAAGRGGEALAESAATASPLPGAGPAHASKLGVPPPPQAAATIATDSPPPPPVRRWRRRLPPPAVIPKSVYFFPYQQRPEFFCCSDLYRNLGNLWHRTPLTSPHVWIQHTKS